MSADQETVDLLLRWDGGTSGDPMSWTIDGERATSGQRARIACATEEDRDAASLLLVLRHEEATTEQAVTGRLRGLVDAHRQYPGQDPLDVLCTLRGPDAREALAALKWLTARIEMRDR